MKKKKIRLPKVLDTEMCMDGDTGEHQLLINLKTKDEKRGIAIAKYICDEMNRAQDAGFFK